MQICRYVYAYIFTYIAHELKSIWEGPAWAPQISIYTHVCVYAHVHTYIHIPWLNICTNSAWRRSSLDTRTCALGVCVCIYIVSVESLAYVNTHTYAVPEGDRVWTRARVRWEVSATALSLWQCTQCPGIFPFFFFFSFLFFLSATALSLWQCTQCPGIFSFLFFLLFRFPQLPLVRGNALSALRFYWGFCCNMYNTGVFRRFIYIYIYIYMEKSAIAFSTWQYTHTHTHTHTYIDIYIYVEIRNYLQYVSMHS